MGGACDAHGERRQEPRTRGATASLIEQRRRRGPVVTGR